MKDRDHYEKPTCISEDNINMDFKGIEWEAVGRIRQAHDRDKRRDLVNTVMNLRVP
jgi:hypothetical protein